MKTAILTTLHSVTPERQRLTKLFGQYYDRQHFLVAVYSDEEDASCAGPAGGIVWAPNDNLSAKWRTGMRFLRSYDLDAVIIAGSDDFIHPSWIARVEHEIKHGADIVVPRSCYIYDAPTGRASYMTALKACGAGKAFSRRLLDELDWNVWSDDDDVRWMPVTAQERRLQTLGLSQWCPPSPRRVTIDPHSEGLPIIDVKCGDNLNSYDELLKKTETAPVDPLWLWSQFPTVRGAMFNWNKADAGEVSA